MLNRSENSEGSIDEDKENNLDGVFIRAVLMALLFIGLSLVLTLVFARKVDGLYGSSLWLYIHDAMKFDVVPTGAILVFVALTYLLARKLEFVPSWNEFSRTPIIPIILILAVPSLLAGRYFGLGNFDLFVDEFMTAKQADMLLAGHLAAPIDERFQSLATGLSPYMTNHHPDREFWGVFYLPSYAVMRAAAEFILDDGILNPFLAAVALIATASVAGQVWANEKWWTGTVAVVFLATTPQFFLNAMMTFPFTAHVAVNMVWLRLFLAGSARGHLGAMLLGVLAIGIHRPHVHVLFAAPFLAALLLGLQGRKYGTAFLYAAVYAIGLYVWLGWADWSMAVATGNIQSTPINPFEFRSMQRFSSLGEASHGVLEAAFRWNIMIANFMRFSAWLNPAVLVLSFVAILLARRMATIERLFGLCVLSSILPYAYLMPNPAIGWGYRFGIPATAPLVLFAIAGWRAFQRQSATNENMALRRFVVIATLGSLLLLTPFRYLQVTNETQKYVEISKAIDELTGEFVLIDHFAFRHFLIRNSASLDNRPLRISLPYISEETIGSLCTTRPRLHIIGPNDFMHLKIENLGLRQSVRSKITSENIAAFEAAGCQLTRN
ncbi:MAG: hypothetical protein ACR2OY_09930 [Boseongicola sp.]